jgi:hypothetical protein
MPKYINLLFIKIEKIIYKQINKLYNNNSNEYIYNGKYCKFKS